MLRLKMMKEYNVEDIELSQPYLFFYDKLEKSNWFLENILKTLDEDLDGHYGVVPKEVYPETFHTSSSREMNTLIVSKLREYAKQLRNAYKDGKHESELCRLKHGMLEKVHHVMVISLGQPPEKITWAFYDKDKKFQEFHDITPLEFYRNHIKQDCKQYVSLIHDPRNAYMKKYTMQYLGNVVGAEDVHYINLPIDDIKRYAADTIKSG
ncbi:bleomycin hydrolase [Coemansia asiatica]|nr:bleomycin hydrolase [Coemansia asiatica]